MYVKSIYIDSFTTLNNKLYGIFNILQFPFRCKMYNDICMDDK